MGTRSTGLTFLVIALQFSASTAEGNAADSGMIISMRGWKAVCNRKECNGYEGLRPLYAVARDPRPMGILLKSRENFILGVSLTIAGGLVAALMAPVVYDPDGYSLAPPVFVFPIGVGIAGTGIVFLAVAHHRWERSISLYNSSLGTAPAR
jgi:hypothetical protein